MELLVQKYLEAHSLNDLAREHGVYASFSKSGHKWSLNYDQIEAKEADPIAQESRGLILAAEDGRLITKDEVPGKTVILAYPMKRFFNHGQGSAANINWSDPKLAVLEKMDGTLTIVYWDKFTQAWCVATRSVPEADLPMDNGIFTFRTLFEKALMDTNGMTFADFSHGLNKGITYCFELTTPYNRIVVFYPDCRITLLAARGLHGEMVEYDFSNLGGKGWVEYDKLTDKVKREADMGHSKQDTPAAFVAKPYDLYGVPVVKAYTYTTIEELVNWVSSLNPMEHEGVVVRDGNFNRIKVKNVAYVAYNKVRDAMANSPRNMVGLILSEKDDDVVPMLPEELVKELLKIKVGLQIALKRFDEHYLEAKAQADAIKSGDKKTFAILVTKDKDWWNAPFFQMFEGKASSMKDFIAKNRKDGTWGDSFLDKMLELSKKFQP